MNYYIIPIWTDIGSVRANKPDEKWAVIDSDGGVMGRYKRASQAKQSCPVATFKRVP